MEARKITVVSTKTQNKVTFMSSAETLGELKADLRQNQIDYNDMTFFEGTSKIELLNDESVLPKDVPYKGSTTNELVFMLTNSNKKIKSGAFPVSRAEAYEIIRKQGLQEACVTKYGRNFTMCKTSELVALIEDATVVHHENSTPLKSQCVEHCGDAVVALDMLVDILLSRSVIYPIEAEAIRAKLQNRDSNIISSSYSNDDISEMFADIKY